MKYKQIGKSDLKVSSVCLGTMTMGTQNNTEQSYSIMNFAYNNGINFIDTAEQYPAPSSKKLYGITEKIVGEWINEKKIRKNIVLATKMSGPGVPWIRKGGLQYSSHNIKMAVEGSLKRLNTDYIDLYQLHWPERYYKSFAFDRNLNLDDNYNKFEEILSSFQILIKEGKIRYLGLSNENLSGLKVYTELIKKNNFSEIVSMQNRYNLIFRNYDSELIKFCRANQISFLGYSPLAFGMLTGKYSNNLLTKSRLKLYPDYFNRYSGKDSKNAVMKYLELARSNNLELTQISLSYCVNKSFLTSSIIGSTNVKQLKEIIDSVNIKLNQKVINEIDSIHAENKNPTLEKEFKIYNYLKKAAKLILDGNFLDFYKKTVKFVKKLIKLNQ